MSLNIYTVNYDLTNHIFLYPKSHTSQVKFQDINFRIYSEVQLLRPNSIIRLVHY